MYMFSFIYSIIYSFVYSINYLENFSLCKPWVFIEANTASLIMYIIMFY